MDHASIVAKGGLQTRIPWCGPAVVGISLKPYTLLLRSMESLFVIRGVHHPRRSTVFLLHPATDVYS